MIRNKNSFYCMKNIRLFYSTGTLKKVTGLQNTFYIERAAKETTDQTMKPTPVICLMGFLYFY
jgi:hypothetical protein